MATKKKGLTAPEAAPTVNDTTKQNASAVTATSEQIALTKHFLDNYQGMSPDSCVTALERIAKMVHDDPKACEHLNITEEHQKFANELVYTGMMTMVVTEIAAKKSAFAITMNKANLELVERIASDLGIKLNDKYLPTPVSEDAEVVEIHLNEDTVTISSETKETLEAEDKVKSEQVELDPTKFKSETDLATALNYILVSEPSVFTKFSRAIALLKSYLVITAGSDEAKKTEIEAIPYDKLLDQVFKYVGRVPIILTGFGRCLYRETSMAANPINAYAILRNASKNRNNGIPALNDIALSGITKVLVRYVAEDAIAEEQKKIDKANSDIKLLSKDKKNAKGVEDLKSKIAIYEGNIAHINNVIEAVYHPTANLAKTFLTDVQDVNSENYRLARKTLSIVGSSYYGSDLKIFNQEELRHNVQQLIGIVGNLFRDPSEQITDYSIANLVDLAETGSKN